MGPTTAHAAIDEHESGWNPDTTCVSSGGAGSAGNDPEDHRLPFHVALTNPVAGRIPTMRHSFSAGQDTPKGLPVAYVPRNGSCVSDHRLPFHTSPFCPIQNENDAHDTLPTGLAVPPLAMMFPRGAIGVDLQK